MMRTIRFVAGVLTLTMAGTIALGFAAGDFGDEGRAIVDLAWGRVTLIDLYVGLAIFGGWIVLRERRVTALPWLVGLVFLGNLAAALYLFVASLREDDVAALLLGRVASTDL